MIYALAILAFGLGAAQGPGVLRAANLSEWRTERAKLLRDWRAILGELPPKPLRLEPETLEEDRVGKVIRRRIRYRTEPDEWTEAYLLLPNGARRAPGVVVFHSTVPYNIRQPAGLEGPESMYIGMRLAEQGFVAICPRSFIYGYGGKSFDGAVSELRGRHPRATGMAKMLADGMRAMDLLTSMKEVDSARLGAIGHSLGAKEALYLAAFDPRVKCAVSSEGGIGLSFSNWEAEWYLGAQIRQPGFARDHEELLALCAPRPFLLLGGDSADGAKSQRYIDAAAPVYRLHGAEERLKLANHRRGHSFPEEAQRSSWEWLRRWLVTAPGGSRSATPR